MTERLKENLGLIMMALAALGTLALFLAGLGYNNVNDTLREIKAEMRMISQTNHEQDKVDAQLCERVRVLEVRQEQRIHKERVEEENHVGQGWKKP